MSFQLFSWLLPNVAIITFGNLLINQWTNIKIKWIPFLKIKNLLMSWMCYFQIWIIFRFWWFWTVLKALRKGFEWNLQSNYFWYKKFSGFGDFGTFGYRPQKTFQWHQNLKKNVKITWLQKYYFKKFDKLKWY